MTEQLETIPDLNKRLHREKRYKAFKADVETLSLERMISYSEARNIVALRYPPLTDSQQRERSRRKVSRDEWRRRCDVSKGKRKSDTQRMFDTIDESLKDTDRAGFPPEFLCGLRRALESGLSMEQITAVLILWAGVIEASEWMDGKMLISKAKELSGVIVGDLNREGS